MPGAPRHWRMHRLYAHLVWTTRQRLPLITADRARMLDRYLRVTAGYHHARVLAVGMVSTHVHVLLRFESTTALAVLVQALKGGSATVLNRELHNGPPLRWERGYSIQSVGPRQVDTVRAYLARQPEHHPLERVVGWRSEAPTSDPE